jgi:hypothetical protein
MSQLAIGVDKKQISAVISLSSTGQIVSVCGAIGDIGYKTSETLLGIETFDGL